MSSGVQETTDGLRIPRSIPIRIIVVLNWRAANGR